MENLQQVAPTSVVAEAEMSVEAFTAAVQAAATQLQAGINAVWTLGGRAVRMAYGGSPHAEKFVEVLLNELPADAARQTYDWLKKAGLAVNRPITGSKLYWLSSVESVINGQTVALITAKKPGEDGFGYAKEKALLYVKTTPPMKLERKEAKAKAPKVVNKAIPARQRAIEAASKTRQRLQKDDPEAAAELNELVTMAAETFSAFYDENGRRMRISEAECEMIRELLNRRDSEEDREMIRKVISGEYEVVQTN